MSEPSSRFGIFRPVIFLIALIWVLHLVNFAMDYRLNAYFGLYPRQAEGLIGIVISPFLHGHFGHLVANTTPLAVLSAVALGVAGNRFWAASLIIMIVGGGLVWVFGRPMTVHVGASGLVFGYFGFLIALGLFERSLAAILGAVIAIALYGGLIWGVFSDQANVSWEGHLFGLLAGGMAAVVLRQSRRR